eukprot:NODE_49_length_31687_cov_0.791123.p9 type:complete len:416 gc:universal NODE_49_length_31687_cov_0.791123:20633-19386(-)
MSHYPMLKMPDLISILSTFNVHLQQDDITKPKPLVVQNSIQKIMHLITGKTTQPMDDTLQMIAIYKQSQKIIKLFVPDYSFNDLLKPESSKFRKILCGCIHFIQLKMDLQGSINETSNNIKSLQENKDNYANMLQNMKIQLEQSKKLKEEEKFEIQNYIKMNLELTNKLKDMKKQQVKFTTHLQQLKSKKSSLNDQVNGIEFKILSVSENIDKINSRRIENMDEFMKKMESLKQDIADSKSKSVNADQQYVQLHGRFNVLQDINHYFGQLNSLLKECQFLGQENKNLSLELSQLNQKQHEKQLERKNNDIKLQQMQRQSKFMQERTKKITDQIKEKQRVGNEKLHSLQSQLSLIQSGDTDESKELGKIEESCQQLRIEISQAERKMDSDQSELDFHLRKVKDVVMNYTTSIQKEL